MPREFGIEEGESSFHDCGDVDAVGVFEVLYIHPGERFFGRGVLRLLLDFLLPMRRGGKEVCGFSSRFINPTRRISFKPLRGLFVEEIRLRGWE